MARSYARSQIYPPGIGDWAALGTRTLYVGDRSKWRKGNDDEAAQFHDWY